MNNVSKALYLAAFALMFVFAASTAIYLYSTLSNYLDVAKDSADIKNRVENSSEASYSENFKRKIPKGEVLITLFNMKQMNVDSVTLNDIKVTAEDVENSIIKDDYSCKNKINRFMTMLNTIPSVSSYSVEGRAITYHS